MPKTTRSTPSPHTKLEEISYIMLQKLGDYILYSMSATLPETLIRKQLEELPGPANPGGGFLYKVEHYKNILITDKRIPSNGEIQQKWRAFAAKMSNPSTSLKDPGLIEAMRFFQVATCLDQNYLKLPMTYSLCQFVTEASEVIIPIASRQEIESKLAVPDYGLGIKGKIADGVYFAANPQ